jgi:peptidyl-tRNA hydrolase
LSVGEQLAQTNHASSQFAYENPLEFREWVEKSNYIVILSTENETQLQEIKQKLINRGITFSEFIEPDYGNQLTAIAISPYFSDEVGRLFSSLPLAGKEYRKEVVCQ